jgi:hypothetical protein
MKVADEVTRLHRSKHHLDVHRLARTEVVLAADSGK